MRRSHFFSRYTALLAGALCVIALSMPARATTRDNFLIRTSADFVELCETQPSDQNYVAAIHFCHGFANGAYQYYLAIARGAPAQRYVCVTDPAPTRDQVIANYLAWARANPTTMSEPAVESLFRHLAQTFPCSAAQRAPN